MTGATSVSPFRLFGRAGRADRTPAGGPDPWLDDPPAAPSPPSSSRGPGPARPDDGPATAAARPVSWTPQRPPIEPQPDPEPVTDPFGFPPVPPADTPPAPDDVAAAWAAWAPSGPGPVLVAEPSGTGTGGPPAPPGPSAPPDRSSGPSVRPGSGAPVGAPERVPSLFTGAGDGPGAPATVDGRPDRRGPGADPAAPDDPATGDPATEHPATEHPATAVEPVPAPGNDRTACPDVDLADAASLAGAFAADLLSWDEEDPARRGHALAAHLADPASAGLLGWTGTGRQRADLVLPGRVRPGADGRVHVDVRVRVVPYRRVDARGAGVPEPAPEQPLGEPAAAPAASARGWRGLAARWIRVEVTVTRDADRLVVDAGPAPEPDPPPPSPRDLAARRRPS